MPRLNLIGQRFGRLVVSEVAGVGSGRHLLFLCICDCGTTRVASGTNLQTGHIKSCGCFRREDTVARFTTHGQSHNDTGGTPEYRSWSSMLRRCTNPNVKDYPSYGGRGILVCERWLDSFENFFADMGKKPTPQHSLDRWPNNNGNYEPGNTRWATPKQQANNRRRRRDARVQISV